MLRVVQRFLAFLCMCLPLAACAPSAPPPSPTPQITSTPRITSTPSAVVALAMTPVAKNAAWTPVEQDFEGVTMVLVPAGCFLMGTEDGVDDERPVSQQCIDTPFWIDKYEVTNEQFNRLNGEAQKSSKWTTDQRPREQITWFEAWDFCALRDGYLPTEVEWEYAARGPDNLEFPWGNAWDETRLVWKGNANNQTGDVGSYPQGQSWVGAQDMAGNVWEWTNSWYKPYPYDRTDGREDAVSDDPEIRYRAIRGGMWDLGKPIYFRTVDRISLLKPTYQYYDLGFRCAYSE